MKRKTLQEFLQQALPQYDALTVIAGDASFRRYFRVSQHGITYIVMDAPPAYESVALFVQVGTAFAQAGLNVPEIIEADIDAGYLLLSDLGEQTLQTLLTAFTDKWLPICLANLLKLQTQGGQHLLELPEYDGQLLLRELSLFPEWFITELLQEKLNQDEEVLLQALNRLLIDSALNQPQVWVHRDYHSRNLMPVGEDGLGIIDFQDAVLGAVTYDLVSLLKDCYVRYPKATVTRYLKDYYIALVGAELYHQDFQQFERSFDLMGLQRHLKVLGIFARLALRDKKTTYLNDLPLVMDYIFAVLGKYPELHCYTPIFQRLAQVLEDKVLK
ncbi:MAG: aminoglycoside phosphotransferase [Gammaproteobacteria bacterium]|nr:MAG: aminoglycoside phosphotransferase [Gammaproteobacteria bacterium]